MIYSPSDVKRMLDELYERLVNHAVDPEDKPTHILIRMEINALKNKL
jgi:hypothetical protein